MTTLCTVFVFAVFSLGFGIGTLVGVKFCLWLNSTSTDREQLPLPTGKAGFIQGTNWRLPEWAKDREVEWLKQVKDRKE